MLKDKICSPISSARTVYPHNGFELSRDENKVVTP